MALDIKPWDVADYLTDTPSIAAYMSAILEDGDAHELARALNDVARAKGGVELIAAQAGISPDEFASAVNENGTVNLDIVRRILRAFGVQLSASTPDPQLAAA